LSGGAPAGPPPRHIPWLGMHTGSVRWGVERAGPAGSVLALPCQERGEALGRAALEFSSIRAAAPSHGRARASSGAAEGQRLQLDASAEPASTRVEGDELEGRL